MAAEQSPAPSGRPSLIWRLAALGVGIALGLAIVAALASWGIYSYNHRSRPRKDWPPIDLAAVGVRASSRTELRSGSVPYWFQVEPLSPKLADDFDHVANDQTIRKSFGLTLRDAGGFQMCGQEVSTLLPRVDDSGKAGALISEGTLNCSISDYLDAASWDITYHFPKLSENSPKVAPQVRQPATKPKPMSGTDELEHFKLRDGFLTTKSGMEFAVEKKYRFTVLKWSPSSPLEYHCASKDECTIENRWNGQLVTGRLVRKTSE